MTFGGNGIDRSGRGERVLPAFVLAAILVFAISTSVSAQMFTDRPPPVPPASVPDPGSAISLAPPSGPASIPSLPAPLTQPSAMPPVVAPPAVSAPSQAVLSLSARYGKDLPVITSGLVWRGFFDRRHQSRPVKIIRRERGATPNNVVPPGGHVVPVAPVPGCAGPAGAPQL